MRFILVAVALFASSAFAQPLIPEFETAVSFLKSLKADSVDFHLKDQKIILEGNVKMVFPPYSLKAHKVEYSIKENQLLATGEVTFQYQKNIIAKSEDEMRVNLDDNSVFASRVIALLQSRYITKTAEIVGNKEKIKVYDSSITTCLCDKPEWELISAEGEYDVEQDKLSLKSVGLNILGLPVIPQNIFDIAVHNLSKKRSYGFIYPQIYYDNNISFTAKLPFYIPIKENFDMTFTPVLSLGGTMLFVQGRTYEEGKSQHQAEIGIPLIGNLMRTREEIFKSRRFLRFIGFIKPQKKVEMGYQWTLADDLKFLRSYALQKKLTLKNQLYLRSHDKNTSLDLRIIQIKDQNPWWGKGKSYTIPFMPMMKYKKKINSQLGIFTTKNSIIAGNEILETEDQLEEESSFLVLSSINMMKLKPFTIGDWIFKTSVGFVAQMTSKGFPLEMSPVFKGEAYTTYVRDGLLIRPFVSSFYTKNIKGIGSKREINPSYENPFLLLPNLRSVNILRGDSEITAIGVNMTNLDRNRRMSFTPAIMFKDKKLLLGGNTRIELGKKSVIYTNAFSIAMKNKEIQTSHNLSVKKGKSTFTVGIEVSGQKEKAYSSTISTFQTPISDQAIFHTSFQKTTSPYDTSMVAAGLFIELDCLSLSTEIQLNEKKDFVVLFKLGLRDFFSFGTSVLFS